MISKILKTILLVQTTIRANQFYIKVRNYSSASQCTKRIGVKFYSQLQAASGAFTNSTITDSKQTKNFPNIILFRGEEFNDYTTDKFAIVLIWGKQKFFKQNIDGIDKLPEEFVDKMIEYGLFDAKMCAHTVAKYENRNHVKKKFVKDKAPIATQAEVSFII